MALSEILIYLLLTAVLLLLNAFFVLVEFASVKMRTTRVEELVDQGDVRARIFQHVQGHLDEYLSVCQVGITFASIGLGFAGKPVFQHLLTPVVRPVVAVFGGDPAGVEQGAAVAAVTIAYILVSFLHILLGELVPKSVAIRRTEGSALRIARPLRFFRRVFYVPLVILNGSANLVLRLLGIPRDVEEAHLTEQELKIVLERSRQGGMLSFRQLLLVENIFDFGGLKARDAMRLPSEVKVLRVDAPWEENVRTIRESRHSRFPLVEEGRPLGIVHVKDLIIGGLERPGAAELRRIARPFLKAAADAPLEGLLTDLQRSSRHVALVMDREGRWAGYLTLEDVLEEITGAIEDEFEIEPRYFVADALTAGRIVLGVQAEAIPEAIRRALSRVPAADLALPWEKIAAAVIERERAFPTYLGRGLSLPHARLEGVDRPAVVFARLEPPIKVPGHEEGARLMFILIAPASQPRIQVRLLARIAGLMDSAFVVERLEGAKTPQEILEAIRAGEPLSLS